MKIQRKVVDNLADKLEVAYYSINEELTNDIKATADQSASDLVEIDKDELDIKIAGMLIALKKLTAIKAFDPKKPL